MRQIANDAIYTGNDLFSLEKDEARGDVDNIVIAVEHDRGCGRDDEAIKHVAELVNSGTRRFLELEQDLGKVCGRLGASPQQTQAAVKYADAMKAWVIGNIQWSTESALYLPGNYLPANEPGYVEGLLPEAPVSDRRVT